MKRQLENINYNDVDMGSYLLTEQLPQIGPRRPRDFRIETIRMLLDVGWYEFPTIVAAERILNELEFYPYLQEE